MKSWFSYRPWFQCLFPGSNFDFDIGLGIDLGFGFGIGSDLRFGNGMGKYSRQNSEIGLYIGFDFGRGTDFPAHIDHCNDMDWSDQRKRKCEDKLWK